MSVFRLVHISDIHLTPFVTPSWLELCNKRITGWLNWKWSRSHGFGGHILQQLVTDMQCQNYDHLIISGDLVNLSLSQEFFRARKWLEKLGSPGDVSLTFGNHDAYVPGALKKAVEIFAPWIAGDDNNMSVFPYCRKRGEVAIIGINSARSTRPFSAQGFFKQSQAQRLANILAKTRGFFRVVVIHHPPVHRAVSRHKSLQGIDLFCEVVKKHGVELILHGHSHLPSLNFIGDEKTSLPVVGVACASQGLGGHKPAASMNIFDIQKQGQDWQCYLIRRTLMDEAGTFAETERQSLKIYSERM